MAIGGGQNDSQGRDGTMAMTMSYIYSLYQTDYTSVTWVSVCGRVCLDTKNKQFKV